MKKPAPAIGLVIRYDFLWSHERDKGYQEGAKERPCVIVTAIVRKETGDTEVLVAPITHSPPQEGTVAIEIPSKVGRHLGLDDERSYIIANEANSVSWDDPGIVPAVPGKQWAYGFVPKGLYDQLRATMLDLAAKRKIKAADRKG
ncbi:type II toxin-antitoxin system PemK/MazF family toxin [Brevundimonas sp.]|uniref:type II toxin-antitoxin system PemK/MazF family toxin n=1 Tax=Brevundimonas sp. TaxID=1871086 RepID=UPI00257FE42A|nr:type II toxin-antitoxin system PemK/MazF family toxin [Brevundimonas sp.]